MAQSSNSFGRPYYFQKGIEKNRNSSHFFKGQARSHRSTLISITLPSINTAYRLHLLAMSISPSVVPSPDVVDVKLTLSIRRATFFFCGPQGHPSKPGTTYMLAVLISKRSILVSSIDWSPGIVSVNVFILGAQDGGSAKH